MSRGQSSSVPHRADCPPPRGLSRPPPRMAKTCAALLRFEFAVLTILVEFLYQLVLPFRFVPYVFKKSIVWRVFFTLIDRRRDIDMRLEKGSVSSIDQKMCSTFLLPLCDEGDDTGVCTLHTCSRIGRQHLAFC